MSCEMAEPIKVTVSDPDTGEVLAESVVENDYAVICAGNHYVHNVARHANGTVVVTVTVAKDGDR